jgi:hypothetical protein
VAECTLASTAPTSETPLPRVLVEF